MNSDVLSKLQFIPLWRQNLRENKRTWQIGVALALLLLLIFLVRNANEIFTPLVNFSAVMLLLALYLYGRWQISKEISKLRTFITANPQVDSEMKQNLKNNKDAPVFLGDFFCQYPFTSRKISRLLHDFGEEFSLSPQEFIEAMAAKAKEYPYLKSHPTIATGAWNIGFRSIQGNVKDENEDYGVAFEIDDHQCLVIADGCGGIPHGKLASRIVVYSAALSIIETFGLGMEWQSQDPTKVAATALQNASHRLAKIAYQFRIQPHRGLHTTLIVIVANRNKYGYAYIGDGGGIVIREDGTIEQFLMPHKAEGGALNVLASSLGPIMEGQPSIGEIARQPGDVLATGSDGVFDFINDAFLHNLKNLVVEHDGDLQGIVDSVLHSMSNDRDERGSYTCDDNMSLALMATTPTTCAAEK